MDGQLDNSTPLENQSSAALQNLDMKDIAEMKSYSNPPEVVKDVTAAVMICFDAPTDWASFKKFANPPSMFASRLMNFDTVNMSEETLERLDDHIETHDLTNIDEISMKSYGASVLAQWVGAVSHEAHINQTLRPIRERKSETEEMLAQVIYEIEKIEQEQRNILDNLENEGLREAGLQTIYDGENHYIQFQSRGENGQLNTMNREIVADFYPELQFDNQNEASQGEREGDIDQNSLFYISNEIK